MYFLSFETEDSTTLRNTVDLVIFLYFNFREFVIFYED